MDLMNDYISKGSPERGDSFIFLNEFRTVVLSVNDEKIYTLEETESRERKVVISLNEYGGLDHFYSSLKFKTLEGWKKIFIGNDPVTHEQLIQNYKNSLKGEIGKRKLKIFKVILGL